MLRWTQAALGALTAGLYFLFAWRAFRSNTVALLTGLFCALWPFWIINVAEVEDGTLTACTLAAVLVLASLAQEGGAFASLLFGLALAGLALLRATLLPFALVACLWFLLRCRRVPRGWLCGLVAVLGLANGLTPWGLRNYQAFRDVLPVSDATYLHLWMGNNRAATGGPQDEELMRCVLGETETGRLLDEPDQVKRYRLLSDELVYNHHGEHEAERCVALRIRAALCFVFGRQWLSNRSLCRAEQTESLPELVRRYHSLALQAALLALLLLHLLGWRWTYGWRRQTRVATLALIWIPLPYVLSHAELLSGPRLPLDGVMLCFAAFAVACLVPRVGRRLFRGAPLPNT